MRCAGFGSGFGELRAYFHGFRLGGFLKDVDERQLDGRRERRTESSRSQNQSRLSRERCHAHEKKGTEKAGSVASAFLLRIG